MGETTQAIKQDIDDQRHQLEDNLEGIEQKLKQTTEQVTDKVDDVTGQVQEKVEQVQEKVKSATDWRQQFDQRPMLGLGIAFGGGMLLASMMGGGGGKNQDRNQGNYSYGYEPQYQSGQQQSYGGSHKGTDIGKQHMSSTMDNIKGALMGVAAAQAKSFLSDSVPSFNDEYRKVENENTSSGGQNQTSDGTSQSPSYPVQASDRQGVAGDQ
jgi:uncharacterized protein YjbJ (UPF0337 family)